MNMFAGELIEGRRVWSAAELNHLEDQIFEGLRGAGITPATRVAVAAKDSALYLAAVWAVRRLDAVVVLLACGRDGAVRDVDGVGACLVDCEAHAVLLDSYYLEALRNFIQSSGADVFTIDSDGKFDRSLSSDGKPRTSHPDETALICYTSGTELVRKGVMLSRGTLQEIMAGGGKLNEYSPSETFLASLPLTHMFGFNHTSSALRAGARVVISPDFTWMGDVIRLVKQYQVTMACTVPFQLARLVQLGSTFASFTHWKRIWLGGAQIVAKDVESALRLHPTLKIGNVYGLTEALRSTTLEPGDIPQMLPSIGKPFPGVEVEIRDENGAAIATTEARGIGWIRGPNVMLGYWKRPEATAAVLKDGWFCTNDILRRSADGYLYNEGRAKAVLNCGGEKLSPEVLEHYISRACPVKEVAVLGMQTGTDFDEVVAIVVSMPDQQVTLADVRAACEPHMHSAFLPRRVVEATKLPWKAEGKIDRAQLKQIVEASVKAGST